jgi:hypothetical protein
VDVPIDSRYMHGSVHHESCAMRPQAPGRPATRDPRPATRKVAAAAAAALGSGSGSGVCGVAGGAVGDGLMAICYLVRLVLKKVRSTAQS